MERIRSAATAAPAGHFLLTRRLCAVETILHATFPLVPPVFRNVDHCACYLRYLEWQTMLPDRRLYPTHVTARLSALRDEGMLLGKNCMRRITHLRLPVDSDKFPQPKQPLHPALALQYVVLESGYLTWNHARLTRTIVPFFLSGARIQRVVITDAEHAPDLPALHAALSKYAREHKERRLWVHDTPTDGSRLDHFVPGDTFWAGLCWLTEKDSRGL